jgi:probable rRNA maturation factor
VINIRDESGMLDSEKMRCVEQAALTALLMEGKEGRVDMTAVKPARIRALNRAYREIDRVTDVLSFPAVEAGDTPADGFWGDIMLCPVRAEEQAKEYGHSIERELAFLTVHGMLHLFGFDHILPADEALMISEQRRILERMGVSR